MRAHTTIFAFLTVALPGCSEDAFDVNDFQDDPAITTLNGTWRVISFEDFAKQTVEFKTHENSWDKDIVVTFDDTTDPAWFSGRILTNLVFGEFDYLNKRQFKLRRLGTTEVNERHGATSSGRPFVGRMPYSKSAASDFESILTTTGRA